VRTGSGKSPTTRKIVRVLKDMKIRAAVVRHPLPYGDLEKQAVQRFADYKYLEKHRCTIEEREEYEGHLSEGAIVYAGVDYEKILRAAEKEADIILWDGGNNDLPFYKPDLYIVLADARRPGHELLYYHGSTNVRMADVVIINKVKTSRKRDVNQVMKNIRKLNPKALVVKANMTKTADKPGLIKGKKVLILEDGPTLTHGGLDIGAGYLAAMKYKAKRIVDPRPYAVSTIKQTFRRFKHLEKVLPAMGYGKKQIAELEKTINRTPCDSVIVGTPVDLGRYLKINKPVVNITYDIHTIEKPSIMDIVRRYVKNKTRISP
ncbi:MAG: GTPase, partial [Candidatus Aenigmatarchaeota archaeon]